MKKNYIFMALLAISCQSKTAEQKVTNDTTRVTDVPSSIETSVSTPVPAQPEVPSTYKISTQEDYTVFLLPGTRVFADTTEESNVLMELESLTPQITHGSSKTPDPASAPICNQYFWYNVSTEKGNGWVYGQNVLRGITSAPYSSIDIGDTPYTLFHVMDSGIGASNNEGLTGCNQYYIPYLWNKEKNTISFIKVGYLPLPDNSFTTSYGFQWLSLISSEGGSAGIQSIDFNKSESIFTAFINVGYQEGGAKFNMTFQEREGDMVLLSFNEINEDNN